MASESILGEESLQPVNRWHRSFRADQRARRLADRHYNRQKPGTPQFVPPGRCLVLLTGEEDAFWVTSWPFAEYVRHDWAGAWICSAFRNESEHLSSDLIRDAVAATRAHYGEPPAEGFVTFVDASKVRAKRDPGYCYIAAGWKHVGHTKGGLLAFQQLPEDMPPANDPLPYTEQLPLALMYGLANYQRETA